MCVTTRSQRTGFDSSHPTSDDQMARAALMALLTIGALQGGIAMLMDPLQPLGMSVGYLEGTPIDDYVLPGLFLLGIAAVCLITIAGPLLPWDWKWAAPIERRIGLSLALAGRSSHRRGPADLRDHGALLGPIPSRHASAAHPWIDSDHDARAYALGAANLART